jgi:DNA-binding transcriptional LysR family regulator
MRREDLSDLMVFAAIAEDRSFTRAATRFGLSSSALSHALRELELRLGVKLLNRTTTRSVSLTEGGDQLLREIRPAFADIGRSLDALSELRDRPAGRVRISAHRMATLLRIAPKLASLKRAYPEVTVELSIEDNLVDIVAAGYDAGVRRGERLDKDMIAIRIGPEEYSAVVASPSYLERRSAPLVPEDLVGHTCIVYRHSTSGALHRWAFEKDSRSLSIDVEASFITNGPELLVQTALAGMGLSYVMENQVAALVASGALVRVLEDWSVSTGSDFLYYPSRQTSPALRVLVEALRC